jgi:hypothetical protein
MAGDHGVEHRPGVGCERDDLESPGGVAHGGTLARVPPDLRTRLRFRARDPVQPCGVVIRALVSPAAGSWPRLPSRSWTLDQPVIQSLTPEG